MTRMDDALERWINPEPITMLTADPSAPIMQLIRLAKAGELPPGVAVSFGGGRMEWMEDPEFVDPVHL